MNWPARLGLWRSLVIYYGQPWRSRALRRLMADIITPGMQVFDIGAHVGHRSRAMARAGATVLAIEPQPVFARFLARHVAGPRIRVLDTAVGARPGEARLWVSARHPTVSSLSADWTARVGARPGFAGVVWDETVSVRQTTLDKLIAEYGRPDLVKIDVEGLEADILAGLSEPIPWVIFECLASERATGLACIDHLDALDSRYRYNWVIGEQHRWARPTWCDGAALRAMVAELDETTPTIDIYARVGPVS